MVEARWKTRKKRFWSEAKEVAPVYFGEGEWIDLIVWETTWNSGIVNLLPIVRMVN